MPHIHEKIDFTVVAYIINSSKVLLVLHKQLKRWLPIGGHIELNEDPEQALFREIKEECGLEIEIIGKKPDYKDDITQPLYSPAYLDIHKISESHQHVGMVYIAKSKSAEIKLAEQEHDEIRWFTESELDDPKYNLLPGTKFYAKEAFKIASK